MDYTIYIYNKRLINLEIICYSFNKILADIKLYNNREWVARQWKAKRAKLKNV